MVYAKSKRLLWVTFLTLFAVLLSNNVSAGFLEKVELVKQYEDYFKLLGRKIKEKSESNYSSNKYWRAYILRSQGGQSEYMFLDSELSSTPVTSPQIHPGNPHANPFFITPARYYQAWSINYVNKDLDPAQQFEQRVLDKLFNAYRFEQYSDEEGLGEELVLSVRIKTGHSDEGKERPQQRPFILVPHDGPAGILKQKRDDLNFFCHYINDENSVYEVCVEFDVLTNQKSIHTLRKASRCYQKGMKGPIEQRLLNDDCYLTPSDDDYKSFFTVLEKNIKGDFLSQEDSMSVDVSEFYKDVEPVRAKVIGRGQFSVVFTLENALPGLALRRFPGFIDKKDAHDFLLTHEAAQLLYKDLDLPLEPTRLVIVESRESYTVYMVQKHLREDELAENYIEGLLSNGHSARALSIKSEGYPDEIYDMSYGESVVRILLAVLDAIYGNLIKLGGESSAYKVCCDAKPDNFGVSFSFLKKWERDEKYCRDVVTRTELTDFHPCTLVLFGQTLFDGGPEAKMLMRILGYNPFDVYQEKIKKLADAKTLIIKSLANIAYHAGDFASIYIPDLIDRTRTMLLDIWQSSPELSSRYWEWQTSEDNHRTDNTRLPHDKLFFDLEEINAENVLAYRARSIRANLRLKLHHYLLKLAKDIYPEKFNHQYYIPVDYQQGWWLKTVDMKYRKKFEELLRSRFEELDKQDSSMEAETSRSLKQLIEDILIDHSLTNEAGLRRLVNWHIEFGKLSSQNDVDLRHKHQLALENIERDFKLKRVNDAFSKRLESLHTSHRSSVSEYSFFDDKEGSNDEANEIIKDSLKELNNSFEKLQQLYLHCLHESYHAVREGGNQPTLFSSIMQDEWINKVHQKYSSEIKSTLQKISSGKTLEESSQLLRTEIYLEQLTHKILADRGIPLFAEELARPELYVPALHSTVPVSSSKKIATQQIMTIELTQPDSQSKLLMEGYSSNLLTKEGFQKQLEHWKFPKLDIINSQAVSFPAAYRKVSPSSWLKNLEKPRMPLPGHIKLHFISGVHDRQKLAQDLMHIHSNSQGDLPSFSLRDTVVQALVGVVGRKTQKREPIPLVIIDMSWSIDEDYQLSVGQERIKPAAPRIIVIYPEKIEGSDLIRMAQETMTIKKLNQWTNEGKKYDCLLRVLRNSGEDYWYAMKPVKTDETASQKTRKGSIKNIDTDVSQSSSDEGSLNPAKKSKIEEYSLASTQFKFSDLFSIQTEQSIYGLGLNSIDINELEERSIWTLNPQVLQQMKGRRNSRQMELAKIESSALQLLSAHGFQTTTTSCDNFCIYSSLAILLNGKSNAAKKLIVAHILQKLLLNMHLLVAGRYGKSFARNIVFMLLSQKVLRQNLLAALRSLSNTPPDRLKNKLFELLKLLSKGQFQVYLQQLALHTDNNDIHSDPFFWALLEALCEHETDNNPVLFELANLVNELGQEVGSNFYFEQLQSVASEINSELQGDEELTPQMLFLGLGLQAWENQQASPSGQNQQLLNGFMSLHPGEHMWGDSHLIENVLIPFLNDAGAPFPVVVVTPAVHSENSPLGAILTHGMQTETQGLEMYLEQTNQPGELLGWLQNLDSLTLFNGGLQATLMSNNYNAGTHWQPIITQSPQSVTAPGGLPDVVIAHETTEAGLSAATGTQPLGSEGYLISTQLIQSGAVTLLGCLFVIHNMAQSNRLTH